jgi:histone H3/H4
MKIEGQPDDLARMMGPSSVDSIIRSAINQCWVTLPDDKRNAANVKEQIRRLVERALRDLEEDASAFGIE